MRFVQSFSGGKDSMPALPLWGRSRLENVREALGIDLCGENGEYHTVVVDGPLFRRPVRCACGEILRLGRISAADRTAEEEERP